MKTTILILAFFPACDKTVQPSITPDFGLSDSGGFVNVDIADSNLSFDSTDSIPDLTSNLTPDTSPDLIIDPVPSWVNNILPNGIFHLYSLEFDGNSYNVSGNHYISFKSLGDNKYLETISGSYYIEDELYKCGVNEYEIELDDNGYLVSSKLIKFSCANEYRSKKIKYSFKDGKLVRYVFEDCGCEPARYFYNQV